MEYTAIEEICEGYGARHEREAPLAPHTSMRIGGNADLLVCPNCEQAACDILSECRRSGIAYFILGRGSNVLFGGDGYRGCVILIGSDMAGISVSGCTLTAGAGAALSAVCGAALEHGLCGMEFAYGIPGSIGGALCMNAGAYGGEMKDVVSSCRCIDESGRIIEMSAEDMCLRYRGSVFSERSLCILSVTLTLSLGDRAQIKARMEELLCCRRAKQPLEYPSCGSTFKRPKGYFAAALIEECGLKGCTIGGAQVSEKHSGFVINKGGATFEDVTELVRHIKATVMEQKGVELECEMIIVCGGGVTPLSNRGQ